VGIWDVLPAHDPFNIGTSEAAPGWTDRLKQGMLGQAVKGVADMVTTPARQMQPNPYPAGTEEASWYADNNSRQAYNWGPEMALNMIGVGGPAAMAGATPKGAIGSSGSGIKAYHGSPHDFDRFDLSKIGTGEGTQMEGLGLYFAQDKKVADFYHKSTVKELMARDARSAQPLHPDQQRRLVEDIESIIKKDGIKAIDKYAPPAGFERAWDAAVASAKQVGGVKGKRYEVNINADIKDFYDLDKQLKDQLPHVYDAMNRVGRKPEFDMGRLPDDARGAQLRPLLNNPKAIADLAEHGVPGSKYWDQMSRTAGDGTKNLVVFDDKLIDILRKYGIALPGATAAGSQMLGANQPAPMAGL
jgi:hypothetical protein